MITVATLVGHLIPPFLILFLHVALVLALVLSAAVLFGVGTCSATNRVGVWWKTGLMMVVIGLGTAATGIARLWKRNRH